LGAVQACSDSGSSASRLLLAIWIEVMAKISPFKFMQEVRQEAAKITWPSRRETFITTIMVFVMSFLAGIFFLGVDQAIRRLVTLVLGIGS
jgi:preprotein translocase subunit SecE